ncbi:MAG TPA: hypothetical protein VJM12_19355, partial [Pyrinomonadaceae bacterium]|nr:hypothetical protein [Pyrinomonadaceae bacterium]
ENGLRVQEEKLASYIEHDEVVLWFEHDLFCQINLLYLLDWFSERELGNTRLSLVFIGEYPGVPNFRGLGELTPEQMASLFPARREVSPAQFELATKAWAAYSSPDPTEIERLLEIDFAAMPFLKQALRLHLERFPFVRNGLGRIQNKGLEFIENGLHKFTEIFPRFADAERFYGLGDSQFWIAMSQLVDAREPLLKTSNGNSNGNRSSDDMLKATFEMTATGAAVLNGDADFVDINGLDTWLGGVHLSGKSNIWRWDDQRKKLALT